MNADCKRQILTALASGHPSKSDWDRIAAQYPADMTGRSNIASGLLEGEWLGGVMGADLPSNWTLNPDAAMTAACGLMRAIARREDRYGFRAPALAKGAA